GDAFAIAALEAIEDGEYRFKLAGYDGVVELVTIAFEFGDVAREEVTSATVELFDEAVQNQRGNRIVDRRLAIVRAFDDVADQLADSALAFSGAEVLRGAGRLNRRNGIGNRRLGSAGEQSARQQQCRQAEEQRETARCGAASATASVV